MNTARSLILTVLATTLGVLVLTGGSAFAATEHVYKSTFGEAGAEPGKFSDPAGIAVNDKTGDLYVVDKGNNRVERFSSIGAYLGQFNGSGSYEVEGGKVETDLLTPPAPLSSPESIAIDNDPASPSYQDVYVADVGNGVVDKFSASGAYLGQLTGFGGALYGMAVDTSGTVWVYEANKEIARFSGAEPNVSLPGVTAQLGPGSSSQPGGFAVDSKEDLYTVGENSRYSKFVPKLNGAGELLIENIRESKERQEGENTSGLAVDLSNNQVFLDNTAGISAFSTSATAGTLLEDFGAAQLSDAGGGAVAVDSVSHDLYVADTVANDIDVYDASTIPVKIEGESVSSVEASAATFEAEIDPGETEAPYHFEYGPAAGDYDASVPQPDGHTSLSKTAVLVSVPVSGLTAAKTYHYRVVTVNALGENVDGPDKTFTTSPAPGSEPGQSCPNEKLRAEQPFGLKLPDCRAYEMVSPVVTGGQDATSEESAWGTRAAVSGEAVTYVSSGSFGEHEPAGASVENQLLSHRNSANGRWETQPITPLYEAFATETEAPYEGDAFTPELTAGIANTNYPLVEGAAGGKTAGEYGLYVADFGSGSYRYVAPVKGGEGFAYGVSSDLTRVMLGKAEWVNGSIVPVMVTNEGEQIDGAVGAEAPGKGFFEQKDFWHAVSSDGSRVYFSSPSNEAEPGAARLYGRVNLGQPQSPLAKPEASGAGTLTAGSDVVSSLVSAAGVLSGGSQPAGTTKYEVGPTAGRFVVGQPVAGPGIAAGTTVTAVSITPSSHELLTVLTLSEATTEAVENGSPISSLGPAPFKVGERIAGAGIAPGTTITGEAAGELTLSAPAVSSATDVALTGGGECTVPADACTVEVSASQRTAGPGPQSTSINGNGAARYWGASADGSKVFFTSHQELTNDADTGRSDEQVIAVSGGGGTYTLTFKGQTTVPISYAANAGEVQTALEALSSIEKHVTVSEIGPGFTTSSAVRVTFKEALGGSEQPALIADGSSLTGVGYVTVNVPPAPGNDLYEYDLASGKLTDLSADTESADAAGAAVQGVVQISEDGSYVYFVAKGALAAGAKAQQCRKETEAEEKGEEPKQTNLGCDLYVSHEGRTSFIATLAAGDSSDWENGALTPADEAGPEVNTDVVNPSGTRLAFMSAASLTGYDNHDASTGQPDGEVYLYDAESGSHPPGLVCASCDPSGARPLGPSSLGNKQKVIGLYRARNLLEDGTLFFDSSDALVPHASDGRQNVYEYENGHVYAISNVAGGGESFFMDASASGDDVFFASADQLLPEDTSGNIVVYDAHVDGGFPAQAAAPTCDNGDSCKPPASPQPSVFAPTGSATFNGLGNFPPPPPPTVVKKVTKKTTAELKAEKLAKALKVCAKDKKKAKRAKCQKQAKQKYGAKKSAKKASNKRRAK
jgi:hypothetical protein